jgi:hypothetical protein
LETLNAFLFFYFDLCGGCPAHSVFPYITPTLQVLKNKGKLGIVALVRSPYTTIPQLGPRCLLTQLPLKLFT